MKKDKPSVRWLKVIVLILGESSTALGFVAVVGSYTRDVNLLKVIEPFLPTEYNAALGFILCGLGLLSIGFGSPRLAIASGMAGSIGLLVVYFGIGLPAPEALPERPSPVSQAVLVVGLLAAFLLALAVHLAQTAWLYAKQPKAANQDLERQISERKRAEEEVVQAKLELEEANRTLEDRVQEKITALQASNRELKAFSYSVSHDLRAPLRSIDGFSQALLEDYNDKLDATGKNYLERVRAASQRMARLIDDLLQLSRLTRGEMNYEPVDLSQLVQSISSELKERQPERRVDFVIKEELVAQGDVRLLQVVLENLLGNAFKFTGMHPSAVIEFGSVPHNGKSAYYVRDDGAGFDMVFSDKLFGAFQRLHGATEFEGTGIGLATVQRIIHRHGGLIWAESAVEKGATFYFTL